MEIAVQRPRLPHFFQKGLFFSEIKPMKGSFKAFHIANNTFAASKNAGPRNNSVW
jgi:hypothetical protein